MSLTHSVRSVFYGAGGRGKSSGTRDKREGRQAGNTEHNLEEGTREVQVVGREQTQDKQQNPS
jgi:hypothetical protein